MNGKTYYLSANTGGGYVSFFDDVITSYKRIIVIKNAPPEYKKSIFNKIKNILDKENLVYDDIIRSGTENETDALLIDFPSAVIADENIITGEIPLHADIIDFINILACDCDEKKNLAFLQNKTERLKRKMISHLSDAKKIHDEWEKIYISNLDFDKINTQAEKIISDIFSGIPDKTAVSDDCNRFFGTLLPRGNINYINELTKDFNKRIFIKGRPGTGKSTILKKFKEYAKKKGYNTETYYCSLDTKSLDMVIVREIGLAFFDSTSPHEMMPVYDSDTVFNVYEIGKKTNIDEYYSDELMIISNKYNDEIKKAKECLYTMLALREETSKIIKLTNEDLDDVTNRIISMASIK
ncbi:MAG: hypothetical protein J6V03_07375 [Clostridia bacterium]|nr:hypothetical protein [Clostridia bacterium]